MELRKTNRVYYCIDQLTPLQLAILCLLASGYSCSQIVGELGCKTEYVGYVQNKLFKYYRKDLISE